MLELNIDWHVGFKLMETKAWDTGRGEAGIQTSGVEVSLTLEDSFSCQVLPSKLRRLLS